MSEIETRADLIRLLKEYGDEGMPVARLRENGIAVPSAAVAELRRAGYGVEIVTDGGGHGADGLSLDASGRGEEGQARLATAFRSPEPEGAWAV